MQYKYSFDGKGINDVTNPYKPRIATLSPDVSKDHGKILGAAGDMLAALENVAEFIDNPNMPMSELMARVFEAIAKAKRGSS